MGTPFVPFAYAFALACAPPRKLALLFILLDRATASILEPEALAEGHKSSGLIKMAAH
jgi:hypothetical protein